MRPTQPMSWISLAWLATGVLAAPVAAQEGRPRAERAPTQATPPAPDLTPRESRIRLDQFRAAPHWSVRSVVLAGLDQSWHPDLAPALVEALTSKDVRIVAQGVEALRRMRPEALQAVATPELITALVEQGVPHKQKLVALRAGELLARIFPDAGADSRSEWQAHWRKIQPTYAPTPWQGPADTAVDGRSVSSAADRALDLSTAGLEICFVIDATGSMQPLLDAVVSSAQETSEVLQGFATELRLATVIYRDHEDMPGASDVVEPLTKKLDQAYRALDKVVAGGGGDLPEAIDAGLEQALSLDDVGWSKDANKLLIIMGDAPAHERGLQRAVELARDASIDMGVGAGSVEKRRKLERSGRKQPPRSAARMDARPFVVSAIAAMHPMGSGQERNVVERHLKAIAEAGKGMYAALEVGGRGADASVDAGARELVQMVVQMSFGSKYEHEVRRFLDVYFEYRAARAY